MTDQTARHTARAQEEVSRAPAAASEQAAAPQPSTALEREHAETKDRLLRALAEMENLRKRTDR
jgi:molecular chaperone GrpE